MRDHRRDHRLRVLWVLGSETTDPAVPRTNGVEVLFSRMAPLVDQDQLDVTVAYPDYGPLAHVFDTAKIPRVHFPKRWGGDGRIFLQVLRMLRETGAQVAHSNSGPLDLHVAAAARLTGTRHLSTRHVAYRDVPIEAWRVRAYEVIDRACVGLGSHFVAISDYGRRILVDEQGLPPSRVTVIPNGYELPAAATLLDREEARQRLGLPVSAPVVGMVARLEPHKGGDLLLDAVAALVERFPDLTVAVAGRGPHEAALKRRARELGLGDRARFLGFVADVGTLYDALDALVLPSYGAEGVPNVLGEALSHGCPCIATRVCGVPDVIVDGETGWLVEPRDEAALRDVLAALLSDPAEARRRGQAGRQRVAEELSLTRMVRAYEETYRRLVGGA